MPDDGGRNAADQFLMDLSRTWWPGRHRSGLVTGGQSLGAPPGQRFLPLPPRNPRILVPLEQRRAAAGTLLANVSMRKRQDQLVRHGLALSVRSGVAQQMWRRYWVGVVQDDPAGPPLVESLRDLWRPDVCAISFTVRRVTPNYKPTFVAVDAAGRVLGYGKLASTPGTTSRLQREADGLRWMDTQEISGLRAPELLASFTWGSNTVAVVSPLPAGSRRYPSDDRAPTAMLTHALESPRLAAAGTVGRRLTARITAVDDSEFVDTVSSLERRFESRYGDQPVPVGRIHGDWVPWNMAVSGADTWVFDWEHSEPDAALALDIVHWHLLVGRDRYRLPLREAVVRADSRASRDLESLGFDAAAREMVLSLSRLHLAARAIELYHDSGLWMHGERAVLLDLLARTA